VKYFLLVYDRMRGELVQQPRSFPITQMNEAVAARNALLQRTAGTDVEVVLLGADSLEDLKRTHTRYFLRHGVEEIGAKP
jgi:hypothetical protein